ncbi:hypothetical protein FB451DRAFT_1490855 [Mycena latifolia]|nr:hypothetical protein FB451DRAFT_1490855 [Mycena latifolia]
MRVASTITAIFVAASVATANIIPKELGELAARDDPDKLAILGELNAFLTDFSYPNYITVAKNITYSGFSDSIVGRLDLAIVTTITYYDWKGTVGAYPVQIDTWFRFDDDLKIVGYDIGTRRFAWLYETITPLLGASIAKELGLVVSPANTNQRLIQTRAALDICAAHDQYCTGANQQYATHAECVNTLLNVKPLGEVWKMGIDNTLCRWVHFGMVQYRPSVHCPHIGPTGGDMCQDRTYTAATLNNPFPLPFIAP